MRAQAILALFGAATTASGCVGYQREFGFRAHQAVLKHDVQAFEELMEEAASATPKGPHDNPKQTVLTHFLDLAGDPSFFPHIDAWRQKGWVGEEMKCSIHRAHYRATKQSDPAAAWTSVEVCLDTARAASTTAEKSWQVADCLEEASFLTQTATAALVPFMKLVADPNEPLKFRVALLDGMTNIPVAGARRHKDNDSSLTAEQAEEKVDRDLAHLTPRLDWIIAAARPFLDVSLLASGTARGAMQIEYAAGSTGKSFVGRYAQSANPEDGDLAWGWVRAMKNKKPVPDLSGLGIWNRERETKDDVYWYICTRPGKTSTAAAALGPVTAIDAISVRAKERLASADTVRTSECTDKPNEEPYPSIAGPYPAESIARSAASDEISRRRGGERAAIVLRRRVLR
jgi:hypothetical protein